MKWQKKSWLRAILTVSIVLFFIELLFVKTGFLIPISFAAAGLIIGWKRRTMLVWKVVGIASILLLLGIAFELVTIRLLLFVGLVAVLVKLSERKRNPVPVRPAEVAPIQNLVIGHQTTPYPSYVWQDISFNQFIGDTYIDLTTTFIPEREVLIVAQQAVGELTIVMPYHMEYSMRHSALIGETKIVGVAAESNGKQHMYYETPHYGSANSKVRILVTGFLSRVKVVRG